MALAVNTPSPINYPVVLRRSRKMLPMSPVPNYLIEETMVLTLLNKKVPLPHYERLMALSRTPETAGHDPIVTLSLRALMRLTDHSHRPVCEHCKYVLTPTGLSTDGRDMLYFCNNKQRLPGAKCHFTKSTEQRRPVYRFHLLPETRVAFLTSKDRKGVFPFPFSACEFSGRKWVVNLAVLHEKIAVLKAGPFRPLVDYTLIDPVAFEFDGEDGKSINQTLKTIPVDYVLE